ncbi:MAG: hypothetical protein ACO1OC_03725 [Tuberibacillus sp.]
MGKKIFSWIGSLAVIILIVFSLVILFKNYGSWTSIDYIWFGAIILFFIGVIGERVGKKEEYQQHQQNQ